MTVARQTYGEDPCFYPHLRAIVIGRSWDRSHKWKTIKDKEIGIHPKMQDKIIETDDYLEINTNRILNCTFENCSAAIGFS